LERFATSTALAGAYHGHAETYRLALANFDRVARQCYNASFADCDAVQQDGLLAALEQGSLPDFLAPPQREFFSLLCANLQEGLFADPAYSGNHDMGLTRFHGSYASRVKAAVRSMLPTPPSVR
jgi:hypothetical protein